MQQLATLRGKAQIQTVRVIADRIIEVIWDGGEGTKLDLLPLLANHRSYKELRTNDALFATLSLTEDRYNLVWSDGCQMSASALLRLPRTVMDAQELRAIMADLHLSVEGMSALFGLSRRAIADYRSGSPIPRSVAMSMHYLHERGGI